jgi:hypothetical protein
VLCVRPIGPVSVHGEAKRRKVETCGGEPLDEERKALLLHVPTGKDDEQ